MQILVEKGKKVTFQLKIFNNRKKGVYMKLNFLSFKTKN